MLINPNVQQTSYSAQPAPVPNGVGQADIVRSDLPPIEQPPETSAGQNQQQTLANTEEPAVDTSTETANRADTSTQTADRAGANSGNNSATNTATANSDSASDERRAEQQREQDAAIISQLKARDREVRLHEAAHAAVGGRYAGAPNLQYERGPDGVNYAVSGEVSISVSKAATPEATLEKARQIRAAATAPAEPSAQDRAVAAEASRLEAEARTEIQAQEVEERQQRSERLDETRSEDREDERVTAEEESRATEEVSVADTQVENAAPELPSITDRSAAASGDEEQPASESDESEDEPNAREQLEEILLGNRSIPETLNQAGLVDTQNPYGKSGFIEYIV